MNNRVFTPMSSFFMPGEKIRTQFGHKGRVLAINADGTVSISAIHPIIQKEFKYDVDPASLQRGHKGTTLAQFGDKRSAMRDSRGKTPKW